MLGPYPFKAPGMIRKNAAPLFIALLMGAAALAGCASDDDLPVAAKTAEAAPANAPAHPANLDDDIRQAEAQRAAHDLTGATRTLSQLMLVAPDDPRVVGEYGKVLAERGRSREAVDLLTRATQLKSDDWRIYSALGVAEDQLGKPKAARAAYEQALALKPNEPSVLNNYALSSLLAGDPATAERLIQMAVAHGGNSNPKIMRNIALINSVAAQTGATPAAAPPVAAAHPSEAAPHATARRAVPHAAVQQTAMQPVQRTAEPPRPYAEQRTAGRDPEYSVEHTDGHDPEYSVEHIAKRGLERTAEQTTPATGGVVMQAVPFDPLAGQVEKKNPAASVKHEEAKHETVKHEEKREAKRTPHKLAAHKRAAQPTAIREAKKSAPVKTAAKTETKARNAHAELASRSAPPPLRMTADASLP
jgi:Flp pilus assembly protein TadD